ncbi:organic hydroperoxide resistance transcriptional regulator OhrR [Gottschalkiaceae bacterium SANA]|nr:organic hydroperoxide resistance transcriptional regulator OhrR [Gottschalkiaceae bacterium SANA]
MENNKSKLNQISDDDILKLDNQLCFALYVSSREIIKKYKPLLDPLGLTYTGYITLLALWEKDNVTIKSLGERLHLDSGTLTPLLKKLEAKGLLIRERRSDDERNVYITLTENGHSLKKDSADVPRQLISSSSFDDESTLQLINLLHRYMASNEK